MTKTEYHPEFPKFLFHKQMEPMNIVDHFVQTYSMLIHHFDEVVSCSDGIYEECTDLPSQKSTYDLQ
jgi:hypothetical protein